MIELVLLYFLVLILLIKIVIFIQETPSSRPEDIKGLSVLYKEGPDR